jgi:hypothetical protein
LRKLALLLVPLALAACGRDETTPAEKGAKPGYVVSDWTLPSGPGAAQPNLVATPDGRVLLSWISSVPGRRNALRFASLGSDGRWQSDARTIVVGDSLMANWADIPHIVATPDGALWVQWLQKAGGGGYASDVSLSRSIDGGFNWSPPVRVNDGDVVAEHGFVALWPASRDSLGVAWLDGRNDAEGGEHEDSHDEAKPSEDMHHKGMADDAMHHEGRTELRATEFDLNLARSGDTVIDPKTCDCCQTDLAITSKGPLLLYRDRSDDEIRDIAAVRYEDGAWKPPVPVHADGWHMTACPINGPSVAADGNDVVAAWFTGADDKPRVLLARSEDAGDTWSAPVELDNGEAVQGRVSVALGDKAAWVLWVREDDKGQSLWLSRRSPDLAKELQRVQVAALSGRGKATGFPQLVVNDDVARVVWTDVVDGAPQLKGAVVSPRQ